MRERLLAAGLPAADTQILAPAERPQDGALIAVLRGRDASLKPLLLLAHIDVVEAKRADWKRDPFTLVEENGWFRSEEHTSELQSLMRISYAVFCLKKQNHNKTTNTL